ncbi:hypothetical protein HF086_002310 [Spodoptera exigua]|uniref:Uncharacterized protein n=1 Tax=Spodoptera exigua TaxID=7107 RepID=A0A922MW35_SPOEX|nr:hypothetical protein HF086_002310 [Spodoptera exigua]
MCSESLPKEFEKTTEVLPFPKYGLSSMEEFRKAEEEVHHHEWLKKAGLTSEEIKLYQENEAGLLDQRKKIESGVLKDKLEEIYNKINNTHNETKSHTVTSQTEQPSTSSTPENLIERLQQKPITFYPEGHPMNELKQLEGNLFGHMKNDIMPLTKRRKLLRRLQRKKERLQHDNPFNIAAIPSTSRVDRPGSLWDMREMPRLIPHTITSKDQEANAMGPHFRAMYTVRNNKILRLEPVQREQEEYRAVDIVMPINDAEANLLEGTKMTVDDIRKIDRFKDWTPGTPSKVSSFWGFRALMDVLPLPVVQVYVYHLCRSPDLHGRWGREAPTRNATVVAGAASSHDVGAIVPPDLPGRASIEKELKRRRGRPSPVDYVWAGKDKSQFHLITPYYYHPQRREYISLDLTKEVVVGGGHRCIMVVVLRAVAFEIRLSAV